MDYPDSREMIYWSTIHDVTELLVNYNTDTETLLCDVLDSVLRVKPESRQAFQLLGILDYFSQQLNIDAANQAAKEALDADIE